MTNTPVSTILRAGNNDPEAWTELMEFLLPLLWKWSKQRGLKEADCEDVIQEVLLWLCHALPRSDYQPDRSFRNWVQTTLHRRVIDHYRRQKRQVTNAPVEPVYVSNQDEPGDYEILLSQILRILQGEVGTTMWRAFWEAVVNERPVEDVAKELNITIGTVYVAKSRVTRKLRDFEDLLKWFEN